MAKTGEEDDLQDARTGTILARDGPGAHDLQSTTVGHSSVGNGGGCSTIEEGEGRWRESGHSLVVERGWRAQTGGIGRGRGRERGREGWNGGLEGGRGQRHDIARASVERRKRRELELEREL